MRPAIRQAAKQQDDAVRRAGRIVLRMAWQEPELLAHIRTEVPFEEFPNKLHGEILLFMEKKSLAGEPLDDVTAAGELREEAAAELSRSLVEDIGSQEIPQAYEDSVKTLRKVHLQRLYELHSQRADELLRRDDENYKQELLESQRIKNEMDGL